jgi:peptide/nickel transport system permease protein
MKEFIRRFIRNRAAVMGSVWVVILLLVAVAAPWLAPMDPLRVGRDAFVPPGGQYLFGTDNQGRDILSGVLFGARISLLVGVLAALTSSGIGIIVGASAGFYGAWLDGLLMRLTELFQIMPRLFLAMLIIAVFGTGIERIVLVIGILGWPAMARLVRAGVLSLKEQQFAEAARAIGVGNARLCFREILPNALPPAIVVGSLDVAQAILMEAGLSFFGLGDRNLVSWGTMLFNAQTFLRHGWWLTLFPGLAIFLTVIAFNLVGDGVNDALNPKLRERGP